MTTANHTPKPWEVSSRTRTRDAGAGTQHTTVVAADQCVCLVSGGGETQAANAHLIAAAPDMLEVLEFINEWFRTAHVDTIHASTLCGDGDDETTLAEAIQQTIAKARGEQQE